MFDIVIPIGPDDIDQINDQLEYTTKNIIGYRNIYIISCDPYLKLQNPQNNIYII
jgi:flagellar biosynthesis/type III secretory pathway protein FliH